MDNSTPNPSDHCKTCGLTRQWHVENDVVHPFISEDDNRTRSSLGEGDPKRSEKRRDADDASAREHDIRGGLPSDLVLRTTLTRLGILKQQDLDETEAMLRLAIHERKALIIDGDGTMRLAEVPAVLEEAEREGRKAYAEPEAAL